MSANDPGCPPGTRPAPNGDSERPEATRSDATEVEIAVTARELAGAEAVEVDIDVTDVVSVAKVPAAHAPAPVPAPAPIQPLTPPLPQPPNAFASPSGAAAQPAYPAQPYPHPTYPQSPQVQSPYAPPQQQPVAPQAAYAQPTAPQPAYYGWGAPLPPAPPRARVPRRTVATTAAFILVAVFALIGGIEMATPSGGSASKPSTGAAAADNSVRALWRTMPANELLPATLTREGTESYIRLGIDPDETCGALPTAFTAALAPATCSRVLAATYVDRTQTVTTTVGVVVIAGTTANRLHLFQSWTADAYATKDAMMPHVYTVPGTVAAAFTDTQRVAWQSQVSTDGTYLVYSVAGFTDGRTGPNAAARAAGSGSALSSDSPPVQVAGDLPAAIQNLVAAKLTAAQGGSQ